MDYYTDYMVIRLLNWRGCIVSEITYSFYMVTHHVRYYILLPFILKFHHAVPFLPNLPLAKQNRADIKI